MPDSCWAKDPNCPDHCPAHCGRDSMQCSGGKDEHGCPMPDFCHHIDPKCGWVCPVTCGPNETYCPKGADENGCEYPGYCQHNDPTAICQTPCAPVCMDGEHPCPTQKDDRG